jgi:hypothetical protein
MARSLVFSKRAGGIWWRCGCCGVDQAIDPPAQNGALFKPALTAAEMCRVVRDADKLQRYVPGAQPLLLGNTMIALICGDCRKPVLRAMEQAAPRSIVDVDDAAHLLGDF